MPIDTPSVRLPSAVQNAIVAHARAGKPEEVCGIVRGRGLDAFEAIPARNVAEERIENYTVDPHTLLRQFEFEDAGDAMMGIYHSHPVSVAYPSATDAWNAHYPESVYLICSLEDEAAPVVRAWWLVAQPFAGDDKEATWHALRAALPFREVRPGLWGWFTEADAPLPVAAPVVDTPYYLVFACTDTGTWIEGRLVTVRESPVEIV
jgi:proteasome lid subunit RPN8/RPN11